jgi:hypothetical protein
MLSDVMDYYGIYGVARPGSVPFPLGVAGINDWLRVPYVFPLFPNGRPPSERWRPLAWLSGVVVVLVSIQLGLTPEPLENLGGVRSPFALAAHPSLGNGCNVFSVTAVSSLHAILSILSLVLCYGRRGTRSASRSSG